MAVLDPAEFASAGVEQPEFAIAPAGRMGHGQTGGRQLTRWNVNHHSAFTALVAPGGGIPAAAEGGRPGGEAVFEGKAVEVTAVVASELGDERWSPGGRKAAAWLDGGQAAEGCVHKDRLVVGVEHEFVRIHLTGGEAGSGYIKAITALMELAWREEVVEAPDLATGGHPEAFASNEQSHRPIKEPFVQLDLRLVGCVGSEQQQAIGAVRGEGQ